jgi:hypothetical protein
MLYEAAQILLMRSKKWSWLKAWAMQVARRRGRNVRFGSMLFKKSSVIEALVF